MSNIGLIIKQSRLEQDIKQTYLAKGICSVSYLSKLENNQISASQGILLALLNKLSLNINEVSNEDELYISFKGFYKEALFFRNKITIKTQIDAFKNENNVFTNDIYSVNVHLMLIRLYLITGQNTSHLNTMMDYIELHVQTLTPYQNCIFYINKSLSSFFLEDYASALKYIDLAIDYKQISILEKWEIADLYNVAAICYLTANYYYSSIEFALKSLNLYRDLLMFNRAIDCHISIGIGFKRSHKFKEAEEHFNSAYLILKDRGLNEFEGIVNQNMGSLFSVIGNSERSIMYYKASLQSEKTTEDYLITIFSLVKEYSKIKDSKEVIEWCKKGIDLQSINKEQNKSFYYHYKIYEVQHNNSPNFAKSLIEAINFFERKTDYRHVNKYAILLADYFFENKQMKNAGVYYKKANKAMLLKDKVRKWEDL